MKISLITVTYNSSRTLRDTIVSVLAQTYQDIEYIIIDGLSEDNTIEIIKEYEPQFEGRIRWVSEKDTGLYDAMNKGFRMATGEIIGIINSDDLIAETTAIEKRFFVKFGGTSSIVNKESWLSVVCFLPYCTSAFLPL